MTSWRTAQRVLCIRLDNMGDVLMTTPAMRALKQSHGQPHLTLLTSSSGASLTGHLPMIDECWAYDAPWVKQPAGYASQHSDLGWVEKLRQGAFDAAVIFTVYSQSALPAAMLCQLAGIPLRLAHCRENPYALLSDHVAEWEPQQGWRHEVQRQLDLVQTVGAVTADTGLAFQLRPRDRQAVHARLRAACKPHAEFVPGRWLVVHPGASAPSRRWPVDRFASVAAQLEPYFDGVAVTGSTSELPLVKAVCAALGPRALPLAGELSLGELGALIEAAQLLISNNSGPVHLAAALGTPVVDLYALTNPQHTPWQVPHRLLNVDVPCKYCYKSVCPQQHHRCLTGITPQVAVAAALSLMAEGEKKCHAMRWQPEAAA